MLSDLRPSEPGIGGQQVLSSLPLAGPAQVSLQDVCADQQHAAFQDLTLEQDHERRVASVTMPMPPFSAGLLWAHHWTTTTIMDCLILSASLGKRATSAILLALQVLAGSSQACPLTAWDFSDNWGHCFQEASGSETSTSSRHPSNFHMRGIACPAWDVGAQTQQLHRHCLPGDARILAKRSKSV